MQSSFADTGLLRLVTGNNCEAQGCPEMAVWRVSIKGVASHLCAKHTCLQMSDLAGKSNMQTLT